MFLIHIGLIFTAIFLQVHYLKCWYYFIVKTIMLVGFDEVKMCRIFEQNKVSYKIIIK